MKNLAGTSLFAAILLLLAGCGTTRNVAATSYHLTRDVAIGSYRVATAPVHYALRRNRGQVSTWETGSEETSDSDVTEPGRPMTEADVPSTQQQQARIESSRAPSAPSTSPRRVARNEPTPAKTKPSSTSSASSAQPEFPTAKLVPGKSGYVISPFDSSGRYVDVTGYASGSKVKDPWTNKIFIVP